MAMTELAQRAFEKLSAYGVAVMDWGKEDGYPTNTEFVLMHASASGNERFFDDSGDWIRESWVNGKFINPHGIRHDIFEIMSDHHLCFENHDGGQATIYSADGPDDIHSLANVNSLQLQYLERRKREEGKSHHSPRPEMVRRAFLAMKELAKRGAPVWDFHSYRSRYDPSTLPAGTEFVMTSEPMYDRRFADPIDGCDPWFVDTRGLHPLVAEIVESSGLNWRSHLHRFPEPHFRPKELIAFSLA